MLRGHDWMCFAIGHIVLLLWIQTFSVIKGIIWAFSFAKKRQQLLGLFKSIFLRNVRSMSNTRWFCTKNCKVGKENLYLSKTRLGRNKIFCAKDNHSYMSNMCGKELSVSNYNQAIIGKILIFQIIAPSLKLHIFTKFVIFEV